MCGIAGILRLDNSGIDPLILNSLSNTLRSRGSDDFGFLGWLDTKQIIVSRSAEAVKGCRLGLVHRRLSILDLSPSGWQPMGTPDGRYYIIFNGEIYNYLELQTELKALGYQFYSSSDTEVLLAAYAQWSQKALLKLVGMFAFAILDVQARKLFLARDFFGIKPLYYTCWRGGFAFASEIKSLLSINVVSRKINDQQLYDYLLAGITDHGYQTLFTDIQQLPAAHYIEIDLDNYFYLSQPVRYWHIDLNQTSSLSYQEAKEHLKELFFDSIRLHLHSDVPIGSALSGGIDSSSIVMAMHHIQGNDQKIHLFSHIVDEVSISEEKWIDIVGFSTGAILHKLQLQPEELLADIDALISIQDLPFGSTSIFAQYRVFQQAKEVGIKVMLDGQGADEILGGYPSYLATRLASLIVRGDWSKANKFWQKASKLPAINPLELLIRTGGIFLPPEIQKKARQLVGRDLFPSWLNSKWVKQHSVFPYSWNTPVSDNIFREQLYRSCFETSLPMLLRYEDRNSMAHSIESRVPFLTPAIVSFIFTLPEEFIISGDGTSKAIFRQAMRGIVPDSILDRKDKIGFATPEQSWLQELRPWLEAVINSEVATQIPALNVPQMKAEFCSVMEGRSAYNFHIWRWVNLIRWAERFGVIFES